MGRASAASEGGLILERYRPLRPLGSGGSGSVWLAEDERSGRRVALKIVPREGNAGSRAEREAATAARLRHARCLKAYTLARDGEHVYIAYEYVPGRTLRDTLRAGTLSDRAVLQIAVQVLEGLAHAHEQGIVHRDVKPSNVLLAEGKGVSSYLLDFGLALIKEEETLTAVGDVPGTLAYISPERLRGKTAGPAADVWSVGVVLWEALAGRHPSWKASLQQTAKAIQAGAPPLAKARPDLPKKLTALVDRALAVDPAKRPNAAKLASSLRRAGARSSRRGPSNTVSLAWKRGRTRGPLRGLTLRSTPGNTVLLGSVAAGLYALFGATALPFYPHAWPVLIALLVAALAAVRPRIGLAAALAVPIFPLGNVAQGLAVVYGAAALAWLAIWWRRPHLGLTLVAGPLLAPIGALGLLPLALERVRSHVHRALLAATGVLAAGLVSGLAGRALPWSGDRAPHRLRIEGADRPLTVSRALQHTLSAEPALLRQALLLAVAAALLPLLRGRNPWWIAAYGAGLLALALPGSTIAALPFTATVWVTCIAVAARAERLPWRALAGRARIPAGATEAAR